MHWKRTVVPQRFRCSARKWSSERAFAGNAYFDRIFGHSSSTVTISRPVSLLYKRSFSSSMFASQKVSNLDSVGSCGAIFSELSNLICHKPLPVHVSLTTRNNQETVNCIETVDLQGFRPLRDSGIGKVRYGHSLTCSTATRTVFFKSCAQYLDRFQDRAWFWTGR